MRKSHLSVHKQERLIELFVAAATARVAASVVDVNVKTAVYYFHRLRTLIYKRDKRAEKLEGEIEIDESYFGGRRKGKRGRGAAGKVPVFGLLKHRGKVYAMMIPNAKADTFIHGLGISLHIICFLRTPKNTLLSP